ncbi:hypothetical protein HZH66_006429 [Vespula vulgaris]|uniref:Uncharacterized protein n=1 Tax=Vespula vulgaris TaxID=7454 RepID=A0A834K350_VESVU|nr:hypothetical protein HZH66_006429 [Vespula vulgaris]
MMVGRLEEEEEKKKKKKKQKEKEKEEEEEKEEKEKEEEEEEEEDAWTKDLRSRGQLRRAPKYFRSDFVSREMTDDAMLFKIQRAIDEIYRVFRSLLPAASKDHSVGNDT